MMGNLVVFTPEGDICKRHGFSVLAIDPPWSYGELKTQKRAGRSRSGAAAHYRTACAGEMHQIFRAPDFAEKDAFLFLWVTNPKMPFGFRLMQEWGFEYKTTLTWVKTRKSDPCEVHRGGMGFYFRGATEHVLLGVRGRKAIPSHLREPNVIFAPRTRHSEKPDAFYDMVERVTPGERRLDVFARKFRAGWHVYGDEINSEPRTTEEKTKGREGDGSG